MTDNHNRYREEEKELDKEEINSEMWAPKRSIRPPTKSATSLKTLKTIPKKPSKTSPLTVNI